MIFASILKCQFACINLRGENFSNFEIEIFGDYINIFSDYLNIHCDPIGNSLIRIKIFYRGTTDRRNRKNVHIVKITIKLSLQKKIHFAVS